MEYLSPPVIAAVVTGIFAIGTIVTSSLIAHRATARAAALQKELAAQQQAFEKQMSQQKHDFERKLLEEKRRFDPAAIRAVREIAQRLFDEYPQGIRTFSVFTSKIPTYTADELRFILTQMGATPTTYKGKEAYKRP